MIYVIADIHGCYKEYMALLERIQFGDEDELYVLGDVVDRGPEPMAVLWDMMSRWNVYPILGNHDYMALKILKKLSVEISEENVDNHLTENDLLDHMYWMQDGGKVTAEQFRKLNSEEKQEILDYLQDFSLYEEVEVNGKNFVLVHGDLHGFQEEKDLEDYDLTDFLFYRADYQRQYFKDDQTFLVTGHTPTFLIHQDGASFVYEDNHHIGLDCGCVYGHKLAAYCLNTGKVVYVDNIK